MGIRLLTRMAIGDRVQTTGTLRQRWFPWRFHTGKAPCEKIISTIECCFARENFHCQRTGGPHSTLCTASNMLSSSSMSPSMVGPGALGSGVGHRPCTHGIQHQTLDGEALRIYFHRFHWLSQRSLLTKRMAHRPHQNF